MSANNAIPVVGVPVDRRKRYDDLKLKFEQAFGHSPTCFARAPGRVNLIGEHIDYCGYAVLPMALDQDIVAAVSKNNTGKLILRNTNSTLYKDYECNLSEVSIDKNNPEWQKYFLCGFLGISEHLKLDPAAGMTCLLDGTIPKSAGLSSSSALVCCASLVTMHANNHNIPKTEIAEICAHSECYIGTEGGGMDQAISFLAEKGTAKLIEFSPLRCTDIPLPDGAAFVISNSCVELNKAATSHFNIRVVEDRIASQVIAKTKVLDWRSLRRLGDLQQKLDVTLEDMLTIVGDVLHSEPYTKQEVCGILGITAEDLAQTSLSANTLDVESFKLHDRAKHVFSEANRVWKFKRTCDHPGGDVLAALGSLMSASHNSCRDLYECSCPQLDTLVDICLESGALGSRLTGAGWGGCAVSLVPTTQVDSFLSQVKSKFYDKLGLDSSESLFATHPGGGAVIYTM